MRPSRLSTMFAALAAFVWSFTPFALSGRILSDGKTGMTAYDHSFEGIDGQPIAMADFRGRPVLVVNTASQCGFTPQYDDLQALHRQYGPRGLVVLGVPSNDFGAQEPGTNQQIQAFCETRFGVEFPMTEKQTVVGGGAHPFFRWIVAEAGEGAAPRWNFHKYLIDGEGRLVGAWPSRVRPSAPEIAGEIEKLLPR
ncbi:glutathione peroxidase [Stella sp.]|uniref:glutathione peroxidase n=1 Tax=Stella sp. TaxID=2912054 RepID=UPI0035B4E89B